MSEEKKTHPEHKYSVTFVSKVGTINNFDDLELIISVLTSNLIIIQKSGLVKKEKIYQNLIGLPYETLQTPFLKIESNQFIVPTFHTKVIVATFDRK